jgi:hypothetical protein
MNHPEILEKSFRALDSERKARLLRHAEWGTGILCGRMARRYVDSGAG